MRITRPLAAALVLLLALAGSATADTIITRDGQQIETRGPWTEKGKMIVFTLPNGTLGSLRADAVDIEASRHATHGVEAKAEEAEPEKKEAVLVLTDADLPRRIVRDRPEPASAEGSDPDAPEGTAAPAPARRAGSAVQVAGWQKIDDFGGTGFEIVGTLRNSSGNMATDLKASVLLYDEQGDLVVAAAANLTTASLAPGESAQFNVRFDEGRDFASLKFDVSSFDFQTTAANP